MFSEERGEKLVTFSAMLFFHPLPLADKGFSESQTPDTWG